MRPIDADKLKAEFDLIASKSATGEWQLIPIKHIKQIIDNAPTIEPRIEYGTDGQPYKLSMTNGKEYERSQGEWAEFEGGYRCSNCDDIEVYTPNYCPNCGADMRGGAE